MNGTVGNYNAHKVIDEQEDWVKFTKDFVERRIGLQFNMFTTQIEPHDSICEFFAELNHMNTILIGFSQDIWQYISQGYLKLRVDKVEVGSSVMPHKVNPINFENAEGNLGLAISLQ